MTILFTNYYGDVRIRLFCFVLTLSSAFTCAWRDLNVHIGKYSVLWLQLSFWSERSNSLKQEVAGIRLRVCVGKYTLFHHTILPLTNWHWHYKYPWRRKAFGWFLNRWNRFVWFVAKHFVDRRYSQVWERFKKVDANRWAGLSGVALSQFKPRAIPALVTPVNLTAKLKGEIPDNRGFIQFQLCGEPTASSWLKSWKEREKPYPYCDISLFVDSLDDIKENKTLSSYGGELWPTAWPEYFRPPLTDNKNTVGCVYLTKKGADLLLSAI